MTHRSSSSPSSPPRFTKFPHWSRRPRRSRIPRAHSLHVHGPLTHAVPQRHGRFFPPKGRRRSSLLLSLSSYGRVTEHQKRGGGSRSHGAQGGSVQSRSTREGFRRCRVEPSLMHAVDHVHRVPLEGEMNRLRREHARDLDSQVHRCNRSSKFGFVVRCVLKTTAAILRPEALPAVKQEGTRCESTVSIPFSVSPTCSIK